MTLHVRQKVDAFLLATNPKWPPILRSGLFGPQEVTDLFKL